MNIVYEFGPFRLDSAERLLLRDGRPVPLTPKAFDLLIHLVDHHGRLVEKATLMAALWPDTAVEEANLAYNISALRKVLDGYVDGDSMIQTVPTRGYRFVAPVTGRATTVAQPESAPAASNLPPATDSRRVSSRALFVGVMVLAALVGIIATIRLVNQTRHSPQLRAEPALTKLTANSSGSPVTAARISPDGRYLAYVDANGIHVQFIETGDTQLLADTHGMGIYAWAADSTAVRASACDDTTCVGWDIVLVGGARHRSGAVWPAHDQVKAAPDGSLLLRLSDDRELSVDSLNGAPPRIVVGSVDFVRGFGWSADASRVLYLPDDRSSVKSVAAKGGPVATVFAVEKGLSIDDFLELPNQRLIAVVRRASAASQLRARPQVRIQEVRTDSRGVAVGEPRVLMGWRPEDVRELSASADSARLIFLTVTGSDHVHTTDFDSRTGATDVPKRLNMEEWNEEVTSWSADGTAVLLTSNRNDVSDIFKQRLDSAESEPVAIGSGDQFRPEATGDGLWILYEELLPRSRRIMRVPSSGGRAELLVDLGPWGIPRCSFRGRCVLEEWQGHDLIVSELDPVRGKGAELGRWRMATAGFCMMPDGKAAAFLDETSRHEPVIRIASLEGKPPREILVRDVAHPANLDVLPNGAGFLSTNHTGGRVSLVWIQSDGSSKVLWAPVDIQVQFAIPSPDGRHLAITARTPHSNAWMMSRF